MEFEFNFIRTFRAGLLQIAQIDRRSIRRCCLEGEDDVLCSDGPAVGELRILP